MTETVFLANALCLPLVDLQALVRGKMVTAMPWNFLSPGQSFALYSEGENTTHARFWARCELCKSIDNPQLLNALSNLTIWKKQLLASKLLQREFFFLAYLRVYEIPQPIQVVTEAKGEFLPLVEPTMVSVSSPVLNDSVFRNHTQKLDELRPSVHPELEELQSIVSQFASTNSDAKAFEQDIKVFLGWADQPARDRHSSDLTWIKTIVTLGNRSKELDEGKSNYQAGTDFEKIVHRSLEFLGFTVDQAYKGGAGGLDLFCSKPYPLAGECKAGKSIPDRAVEELDRIGKRHLGKDYMKAVRLIIGSGQPTKQLRASAITSEISIISAMTLQKLVELKAKHPGSIDLIELKKYLEPGQIDHRIDEYVEKILAEIRLRAYTIQILKKYLEQFNAIDVDVNTVFGVYCGSNPLQVLTLPAFYKMLIELSSPLTGYLGRKKGNDGSDRFYFLRDLLVD
ncbi:MAG: DUF1802 domain-containing protein [Leptolyngbya sp.]|nr:MAG: DUF1802 domain-containing protein [Leptolyngbya sp.]